MRTATLVMAGVGLAFASLPAAAQSTTRIETRPVYGAVVTIEEGVRVFRPLPPHDRIIINPDGKTPLSLSINQSYNYDYGRNYITHVDGSIQPGDYGVGGFFPNRHIRRHIHRPAGGIR